MNNDSVLSMLTTTYGRVGVEVTRFKFVAAVGNVEEYSYCLIKGDRIEHKVLRLENITANIGDNNYQQPPFNCVNCGGDFMDNSHFSHDGICESRSYG
jgi:hypothetical protein